MRSMVGGLGPNAPALLGASSSTPPLSPRREAGAHLVEMHPDHGACAECWIPACAGMTSSLRRWLPLTLASGACGHPT